MRSEFSGGYGNVISGEKELNNRMQFFTKMC